MNWMDFNKTGDFWKAWQDTVNGSSSQNQASTDPMKAWWNQQERFWKDAMEKTTGMLGNQPDLARQWQDMQGNFMKQWMEMGLQKLWQYLLLPWKEIQFVILEQIFMKQPLPPMK